MKIPKIATVFLLLASVGATKEERKMLGGRGNKNCDRYFSCPKNLSSKPSHTFENYVAIANRNGKTISLVHPHTLETKIEYKLPDDGEPMYFAFSQRKSEIWVGDRANNRLVILRMVGCKLVLDGYIDTPAGLFHSMPMQRDDEYPIVVTTCDIDNVIVAHDLTTRRQLAVMQPPQQAIDANAKPHDVTNNGDYIFATFLGSATGAGFVASYDAYTFELTNVLETVGDPHVAVRDDSSLLIAAQQGIVYKVSIPNLTILDQAIRPSPHGMFISFDLKYLYTTNIAGGGLMAVDVWDTDNFSRISCPEINTRNAVPHNPAVSFDGKYIFITHSGATSVKNSRFRIGHDGCLIPESEVVFDTNLNPFGLFIIPAAEPLLQCLNEY